MRGSQKLKAKPRPLQRTSGFRSRSDQIEKVLPSRLIVDPFFVFNNTLETALVIQDASLEDGDSILFSEEDALFLRHLSAFGGLDLVGSTRNGNLFATGVSGGPTVEVTGEINRHLRVAGSSDLSAGLLKVGGKLKFMGGVSKSKNLACPTTTLDDWIGQILIEDARAHFDHG